MQLFAIDLQNIGTFFESIGRTYVFWTLREVSLLKWFLAYTRNILTIFAKLKTYLKNTDTYFVDRMDINQEVRLKVIKLAIFEPTIKTAEKNIIIILIYIYFLLLDVV